MSFLNPSVLLALTAVSIPVLIHLLNLRKLKKVEFSTLMFLKEIQKSKMKRIKLKQLLLLLFRILLITFLVLAFAKPVYMGYAGTSDTKSKSTTLIYFDDSFSMNGVENSQTYLAMAKYSIKNILDLHKATDEIYFIPFSRIGMKNSKILYKNTVEILDTLKNLKVSGKFTSYEDILILSDDILSASKNPVKEIFIVSDFQKNNFGSYSEGNLKYKSLSDNSVSVFPVNTGNRTVNNISLDSFKVKSGINEKDKPVIVKIKINNYSRENAINKTVNLYVENVLKSEKVIDLGEDESKEIEFAFKPEKTGMINGYFELVRNEFQEDELIQDNRYYFSVYIPEQINLNLVSDNQKGLNFLETGFNTALKLLSDSSKAISSLFKINTTYQINDNSLNSDVIYVSDKKSFSDNEAELLKSFVSNGGGLFIFPGKDADVNNYNSTIINKLNLPKIDKLNQSRGVNENLKFEKIDFEHPVLSGIFRNPDLNITNQNFIIESPLINSYFEFLLNDNSVPVISLNNNSPFLIESKLSMGKVIISAVSADTELSDFPLKTIFLPLVLRSAYYLGGSQENQTEFITGKNNYVSVTGIKNINLMILPDSGKIEFGNETVFPSNKLNYILIPYSENTVQSGKYILADSSGKGSPFSMNYNSLESNTEKMNKDGIINYFQSRGLSKIYYSEAKEDIKTAVNESRTGIELWKYMLLLAVIFLAAEIFLSKKLEKS